MKDMRITCSDVARRIDRMRRLVLAPLAREQRAQGTTEYAILVGVLVVTRVQLRQRLAKREVRSLFCGSPPSNERPSTYEFHRTDT